MKKKLSHSIFLSAYTAFWVLLTPFCRFILKKRIKQNKEDPVRFTEKLGLTSISSDESYIWFHAVSVGEIMSIQDLIKALGHTTKILVTTTTITSAEWVEKNLSNHVVHQFFPMDHPLYIQRFLNNWKIEKAIFIDSEIWPNWLKQLKKKKIDTYLLNARLSDKSFEKWKSKKTLFQYLLSHFQSIIPQSQSDFEKFTSFRDGVCKPFNLKKAASPLKYDQDEYEKLKESIGKKKVILAASTHDNEEEMLASIFNKVSSLYKDLILIIVPRHPNRGKEIQSNLNQNCAMRSKEEMISEDTNIYLADTLGELGLFYALADFVIIGGSFINHGGQNPLQAAHFDNMIILGPDMSNFADITEEMLQSKSAQQVKDYEELETLLKDYLSESSSSLAYMENAKNYISSQKNIIPEIIRLLGLKGAS